MLRQSLPAPAKNPAAVALGKLGGPKGGKARAAALSPNDGKEIAKEGGGKAMGTLVQSIFREKLVEHPADREANQQIEIVPIFRHDFSQLASEIFPSFPIVSSAL